ncbi:BREX-1 system phosphatase PglZ type B [Shewanella sp. VB17]|uniref:BREX-1 system phosphatase PglZ type B n=1 Tax=Shewanella sp. VB17 TaxID=2739432 RepID=UPI001566BA29|nr:BREX-1 system phosphatase PglZ type B [Shewanella sp. VB17]NRD74015.1 BREX-1 system phosphatase PglZ type B [Shewanella sp. VB17]
MIIDYLVRQLRDCANFNSAVQVAPAAILWTDIDKQWQSAMPFIKQQLPELIELGEYKPEDRIGPAIWIKCAIAGALEDCQLPEGKTPIIYLPGVGRKDLRAIEQCPDFLRPLAELQYRGCWWAYNTAGRDWSVSSFLTNSKVGLGLELAKDKKTLDAIIQVLPDILETPAERLQGKKLTADEFYAIVLNDPAKDILGWLNNPTDKEAQWLGSKWDIFSQSCGQNYGFTPMHSDLSQPLSLLCEAEGVWSDVWQRFLDTASNLPVLLRSLAEVEPSDLAFEAERYLSENSRGELAIEHELKALKDQLRKDVKATVERLWHEQSGRQSWIWTTLGLSVWLSILSELKAVLEHTEIPFNGSTPQAMAEFYQERFWLADAAAIAAMAKTRDIHQQEVIADVLTIIYTPWLEQVTLNFQTLVEQKGYPGDNQIEESTAHYSAGSEVIFFVDGLRFDTAKSLEVKLEKLGLKVGLTTQWSALPSLTATAKAAVTPVADLLSGLQDNENFTPVLTETEFEFSSYHFKKALADKGWQYLDGLETGEPNGYAWVQTGDLDNMGHAQQRKMPMHIDAVLNDVVARIEGLVNAGWKRIKIVTDHGWLWVPNKLAEASIPKTLVKKRLARCAILKDNMGSTGVTVPWHWNQNVTIAMAPGIAGYVGGDYYSHGGLSLQECLTPVIKLHVKA